MSILLGLGLVLAIIAITYVGVEVLGLTKMCIRDRVDTSTFMRCSNYIEKEGE